MTKFSVIIREVWERTWEVEAVSEAEAYEKASSGCGAEVGFECIRTLDPDVDTDVTEMSEDSDGP